MVNRIDDTNVVCYYSPNRIQNTDVSTIFTDSGRIE